MTGVSDRQAAMPASGTCPERRHPVIDRLTVAVGVDDQREGYRQRRAPVPTRPHPCSGRARPAATRRQRGRRPHRRRPRKGHPCRGRRTTAPKYSAEANARQRRLLGKALRHYRTGPQRGGDRSTLKRPVGTRALRGERRQQFIFLRPSVPTRDSKRLGRNHRAATDANLLGFARAWAMGRFRTAAVYIAVEGARKARHFVDPSSCHSLAY